MAPDAGHRTERIKKETAMKAVVIEKFGGLDELKVRDVPMPEVRERDLLVEVRAAAVNPVDWKIREGYLKGRADFRFPLVLGLDVAGVVKETGAKASRFKAGDEVMSRTDMQRSGTYAEYVAVDEGIVARKPRNLSFEEAASIPLAGLTAWQALVDRAAVKAGDRVLIHAGAGGVGSLGIQIAKARGAHVAATCGTSNVEFVKGLGADEAVDYTKDDFSAVLKGYDVVLDTMGGEVYRKSFEVLKKGGVVVSLLERPDEALARKKGVRADYLFMQPDAKELEELGGLLEAGKIRPVVGKAFSLEQMKEAHRLSASHHARGKIVIRVKG
jgi:NADPH:quinone reductase-like Zn-dependent oxidoreductase